MGVDVARRSAFRIAGLGDWLQRHGTLIRRLQWGVVLAYAVLIVVPALLPLPDETARVFNHLTVFAQFAFWGIWWPFVLLSMVLLGRVWCGVLCPEGTLTEWASAHGRNRAIPRWMRWGGWPFLAFTLTTVYGQMISVYQYPGAALLVLGGSTVAAVVVGYWYGREKRVWCKYLCPVNGVFGLLAKLAPLHYAVDGDAWRRSYGRNVPFNSGQSAVPAAKLIPVIALAPVTPLNCAPLVAIRKMEGASDCHMCGRCSGHRQAIQLQWRSPNHEVVVLGARSATGWQTLLILVGLLGVALGAFQWTVNPNLVAVKQGVAGWLIDRDIFWPFLENAPGWLLTHHPQLRDVFSWLDGGLLLAYLAGMAVLMGVGLSLPIAIATRLLGHWSTQRFYHLTQALLPLTACSVFLGLSSLTVQLLKNEGVPVFWAGAVRAGLLVASTLWSLGLCCAIVQRTPVTGWQSCRKGLAVFAFTPAIAMINCAWFLMFVVW